MKNRLTRIRKNVINYHTYYGFCAGSLAASAFIMYANRDVTILRLTKEHAELIKQGGAVMYELKDQTLHLVNIAAVEATNAV